MPPGIGYPRPRFMKPGGAGSAYDPNKAAGKIGNQLMNRAAGNTPGQQQVMRSTKTGLDSMMSNQNAQSSRNAARMGIAPGSAAHRNMQQQNQAGLISGGSQILSNTTQSLLADQNNALDSAGRFTQGQQNLGENRRQFDGTQTYRYDALGENSRQFDQNLGENRRQFDGTLGQRKDEAGDLTDYRNRTLDQNQNQFKINSLTGLLGNEFLSEGQNSAVKAGLGGGLGIDTHADYGKQDAPFMQQALSQEIENLRTLYPNLSDVELEMRAREQLQKEYNYTKDPLDALAGQDGLGQGGQAPQGGGGPSGMRTAEDVANLLTAGSPAIMRGGAHTAAEAYRGGRDVVKGLADGDLGDAAQGVGRMTMAPVRGVGHVGGELGRGAKRLWNEFF